ncbi:hypothetical protein [Methylocapsa palsarum]|uniref:Uncharacterized protein n=1 Tax=Methylocapsa palsarum TaxID=1612308 RepID=A0A1I3YVT1_9HYPH|nr:hypothetical protein [Methylocapsa palsarum]SFK35905.1 hypothetical protein SAMN05444581_106221 [Methylocapsa palsarum]
MPGILVEAGMPGLSDHHGFQCERQVKRAQSRAHFLSGPTNMVCNGCDQVAFWKHGQGGLWKWHDQHNMPLEAETGQRRPARGHDRRHLRSARRITYHGRVADIETGSGAAFALLPAQNATGNWIKVVQRVPVRIRLDPAELARNPLRIGLSAKVTVDTGHCDPQARPDAPQSEDVALYAAEQREADATVIRVIAANVGGRP